MKQPTQNWMLLCNLAHQGAFIVCKKGLELEYMKMANANSKISFWAGLSVQILQSPRRLLKQWIFLMHYYTADITLLIWYHINTTVWQYHLFSLPVVACCFVILNYYTTLVVVLLLLRTEVELWYSKRRIVLIIARNTHNLYSTLSYYYYITVLYDTVASASFRICLR